MKLKFELITPERRVLSTDVDELILPTPGGEIVVLPHHMPIIASLSTGVLRVRKNGIEEDIVIDGGVLDIQEDGKIRVLANIAERVPELDLAVIEEAKKRAEQVMQQTAHHDEEAFALAAAAMERELARYRVATKHRHSTHVPMIDADSLPHDENPV